jgi:hypothetical protein
VETGRPVDAYVTVLQSEEGLIEHARAVAKAGATGLAFYHLGLAPAWPTDSAPVVAAAVEAGRPVDAYVTVLQSEDGLIEHARDVARAGATGLAFYHLGLAPAWRLPTITAMAKAARSV